MQECEKSNLVVVLEPHQCDFEIRQQGSAQKAVGNTLLQCMQREKQQRLFDAAWFFLTGSFLFPFFIILNAFSLIESRKIKSVAVDKKEYYTPKYYLNVNAMDVSTAQYVLDKLTR